MGGLTHHIQAGNNAGNAGALKHPGGRNSGIIGDATTAGEAISSAIVKYNYQAQQVTRTEKENILKLRVLLIFCVHSL
jgi:hypothetical protein